MSVEFEVYLKRRELPSIQEWNTALNTLRFPLKLDESVRLNTHSGYLPAMLEKEDTGFEFDVFQIGEHPISFQKLASDIEDKDAVAVFRLGSEEVELVAAMMAVAVLIRLTRGVFFDPSTAEILSYEAVLMETRKLWVELQKKQKNAFQRKKTPAHWATQFLEITTRIHPDYERNKNVKGRTIECIRQEKSGLYVSQNCLYIADTYYHCFAVLFSPVLVDILYYPLLAGGRFDHNFIIHQAFEIDLHLTRHDPRCPTGLHSSHQWRKRAEELVETCCRNAENFLLPFYRTTLANASDRFYTLFSQAKQMLDTIEPDVIKRDVQPDASDLIQVFAKEYSLNPDEFLSWDEELQTYCHLLIRAHKYGYDIRTILHFRWDSINLKATDIANNVLTRRGIPKQIENHCIILNNLDVFLTIYHQLPQLIEVAKGLKYYR